MLCLAATTASAQFNSAPRSFGRGSVEAAILSPDGQRVITSGSDGIYVYDAISLQDIGHLRRSQPPFHRDAKPVFSPDSQLLVMSYADTTAVVWDMETLTEVAVLEGHVEWITALAFSRDGSLMASGDRTGRMKVWATSDWSLLAQHRSELVRELAFQGTQRLVASNGFRAIRIWRLHDFVEETLLVHDDNVGILHVMADERRLVSGASDGTARLWDMNTGETLAIMQQPGNRTSRVMISPDEQYAVLFNASSSYQGTHVWRLDPPQEIGVFQYPDSSPIGISADSKHMLIWSVRDESIQIRFWDFASREFVDSVRVDVRGRVMFNPDDRSLTTVTTTGRIERQDLMTADITSRHVIYLRHVDDFAFSPGGEWLAAVFSRTVHFWDTLTGAALGSFETESSIDYIAFSSDCRDLYIESDGLFRRPLEDLSAVRTIYDGFITTVDFAPDVERAALGWRPGDAAVIDLRRGTTIASFEGHADDLSTVALSADGSLMAVSGEWRDEPETWLWKVADGGELLGRLPARRAGVKAFDFTSDNRILAASGWYDGIQLWDTASLTLIDSIESLNRVEDIAFSPDDAWLAWSEPGAQPLHLMEIESGRRVVAAEGPSFFAGQQLAFSPGGSMIAMGGWAGRVWVWDADTQIDESATSPCADIELRLPSNDGSRDTVISEPTDAVGSGDAAAPTAVALAQGGPNPVTSSTSISFDIPTNARVRLEIYNIQGQRVRMIVDEELELGRYQRAWDGLDDSGRHTASGVYLVRLQVGDQVLRSKLLRVR